MTQSYYFGHAFRRVRRDRRIKLPSCFIKALHARGSGLCLVLRPDIRRRCILAHEPALQDLATASCAEDGTGRRQFGLSTVLEVGMDDCILLPQTLAEFCAISDGAILFGAGGLFEIWDPMQFVQQPGLCQYELDLALSLSGVLPALPEEAQASDDDDQRRVLSDGSEDGPGRTTVRTAPGAFRQPVK